MPKILYSEIVREPRFYLDKNGQFLPEATTFMMTGKSLPFLYKMFHSKVITFFFKRFYAGGGLGEDGYRYKKAFFEKLPIPSLTNSLYARIVQINDDTELEQSICSIFKLTEDEIRYIHSQFADI